MLIEERHTVELGARHRHLEVIAGPSAIFDVQLGSVRERLLEERTDRLGFHRRSW
jgi:hypothetical protein